MDLGATILGLLDTDVGRVCNTRAQFVAQDALILGEVSCIAVDVVPLLLPYVLNPYHFQPRMIPVPPQTGLNLILVSS